MGRRKIIRPNRRPKHHVFRSVEFKLKTLKELSKFEGTDEQFAAIKNIPKQTLSGWKSKADVFKEVKNKRETKIIPSERSTRKWKEEEDRLARKVKQRIQERKLVTTLIIKKMFIDEFPKEDEDEMRRFLVKSKNWVYCFMERYKFSIRRNTIKSSGKFDIENPEKRKEIREFLDHVKVKINQYDDRSIIQMDETALYYEPIPGNTVTTTGAKDVNPVDSVNAKQNFTAVVTVTKAGKVLKPMVIFPLKKNPLMQSLRDKCYVGLSDSSKMNQQLMKDWYSNILLPYLNEQGLDRCLLICDQYGSHKTEEVKNFMDRVDLVLIPSTATSILQPLDVNFFSSLKRKLSDKWVYQYFTKEGEWKRKRPGLPQRRNEAVKSFIDTINDVKKETIFKAFQMCGMMKQNETVLTGYNKKLLEVLNWNES